MNPCFCPESRTLLLGVNLDDVKQPFLAFSFKDRRLDDRWRLVCLQARHIDKASESKQIVFKQIQAKRVD